MKLRDCMISSPGFLARKGRVHGFSLVELLVVMAILILLAAATMPALQSTLVGSNLNRAGLLVGDQIQLARQEAVARNCEVRIVFYNLTNGATKGWCGLQVFRVEQSSDQASSVAITRVVGLPDGIVVSSNPNLSPLLTAYANTSMTNLPGKGSVEMAEIRFRGNGFLSGGVTSSNNFLTLQNANAVGVPPANFYSLQVNPVTGKIAALRP
jgi:uncharacterized protein (TIGR02596 family)